MKSEGKDRRIRRTRQLLHEALISLIQEQPYKNISVQDILDRADIGRSTFYSHFQDKDDLFRYGFEKMLESLTRHMNNPGQLEGSSHIFPSLELFQHIQENHKLYTAIMGGQGLEFMFKYGQKSLSQRIQRHLESYHSDRENLSIPFSILSTYLAGALITLLQWWLDNRMPYPPEQMDAMYRRLALPGVIEILHPETLPDGANPI
ncbi:MAG: TetR/AcrR family transcriptional regulator [Chloroflexi bacterium]|nr:MAG: TetR/AcrR family transcriptional regulator [Chloroflexota bacterium]